MLAKIIVGVCALAYPVTAQLTPIGKVVTKNASNILSSSFSVGGIIFVLSLDANCYVTQLKRWIGITPYLTTGTLILGMSPHLTPDN